MSDRGSPLSAVDADLISDRSGPSGSTRSGRRRASSVDQILGGASARSGRSDGPSSAVMMPGRSWKRRARRREAMGAEKREESSALSSNMSSEDVLEGHVGVEEVDTSGEMPHGSVALTPNRTNVSSYWNRPVLRVPGSGGDGNLTGTMGDARTRGTRGFSTESRTPMAVPGDLNDRTPARELTAHLLGPAYALGQREVPRRAPREVTILHDNSKGHVAGSNRGAVTAEPRGRVWLALGLQVLVQVLVATTLVVGVGFSGDRRDSSSEAENPPSVPLGAAIVVSILAAVSLGLGIWAVVIFTRRRSEATLGGSWALYVSTACAFAALYACVIVWNPTNAFDGVGAYSASWSPLQKSAYTTVASEPRLRALQTWLATLYFSFITQTLTGLGDITAVSSAANLVASAQQISGVAFHTLIIAQTIPGLVRADKERRAAERRRILRQKRQQRRLENRVNRRRQGRKERLEHRLNNQEVDQKPEEPEEEEEEDRNSPRDLSRDLDVVVGDRRGSVASAVELGGRESLAGGKGGVGVGGGYFGGRDFVAGHDQNNVVAVDEDGLIVHHESTGAAAAAFMARHSMSDRLEQQKKQERRERRRTRLGRRRMEGVGDAEGLEDEEEEGLLQSAPLSTAGWCLQYCGCGRNRWRSLVHWAPLEWMRRTARRIVLPLSLLLQAAVVLTLAADPKTADALVRRKAGTIQAAVLVSAVVAQVLQVAVLVATSLKFVSRPSELTLFRILQLLAATVLAFAGIYLVLYFAGPEDPIRVPVRAFRGQSGAAHDPPVAILSLFFEFTYFSLSVESTAGFGDVVPRAWLARIVVAAHAQIAMLLNVALLGFGIGHIGEAYARRQALKEQLLASPVPRRHQ